MLIQSRSQNEGFLTGTIYTKNKDITEDKLIVNCLIGRKLTCKVLSLKDFIILKIVSVACYSYLQKSFFFQDRNYVKSALKT